MRPTRRKAGKGNRNNKEVPNEKLKIIAFSVTLLNLQVKPMKQLNEILFLTSGTGGT